MMMIFYIASFFDLQIMIDVSLVGANFAAKGKTNQGGQAVVAVQIWAWLHVIINSHSNFTTQQY
jgi:hypothetical protein